MPFLYNYYSDKPFVRIVIPYVTGILLFNVFKSSINYWLIIFIFTVLLILFFGNIILKNVVGKGIWWGISLNIFLILLGYYLSSLLYPKYNEFRYLKDKGIICGVVSKKTEIKDKYVRAEIDIKAIRVGNNWLKSEGKSLVYFDKDSKSLMLNTGEWLLISAKFSEPKNLGNPQEFDYKKYLAYHLISSSAFVKAGEWLKIYPNRSDYFVVRYAEKSRDFLLSVLKKMNLPNDVFAVASATIFGYHNEIDAELKQAYSSAGAIHILAVSGFQVGVVYLILQYLFSFFIKRKYLRWLFVIISLTVLWFYAFITGLSPSVLRATAMFSFMVVATLINRQTNIYNTLSASAFFLLILNPLMLFDIGFQLSYVAVLGIVYLQPKLKSLWFTKNKILDAIWSLICVTLAAQIATTPLSIYYFHQFPLYFIVSGLILVPLVSMVIYVTVFLYVFSWFPFVFNYVSVLLKYMVSFMNQVVFIIEDLPMSVIEGIYVNIPIMILMYGVLVLLTMFFNYKRVVFLMYSLICIFLIFVVLIVREISLINQKKVIVYNIPGKSVMNIIDGKENVLFVDEELKSKEIRYAKENWIELGLNKEKTILFQNTSSQYLLTNLIKIENPNIWFYKNFFSFYNFKILVVNNDAFFSLHEETEKIEVDLIIIQKEAKVNMNNLLSKVKTKYIVFDSSCPKSKVIKWQKQVQNSAIKVHSVFLEGAWTIDI